MKITWLVVFCWFTIVGELFGQNCFLKSDTVFFLSIASKGDYGANGITTSLDSVSFIFDDKSSFYCSFVSSVSYTHPFMSSMIEFIKTDEERRLYEGCFKLEGGEVQPDKSKKKLKRCRSDFQVRLNDGTRVSVMVVKLWTTLLGYERNNDFIFRPMENFNERCFTKRWSYLYEGSIEFLELESYELDRVKSLITHRN